MKATARACSNIALVKYWGKRNDALNLPAAGSLSVTLGGLHTVTTVQFDEALSEDTLQLQGASVTGRPLSRITQFLDIVRAQAGTDLRARVVSENDFPTAAGLASSASGFAALAVAGAAAAGLRLDERELSTLARRGSGSAARSIAGGFVLMHRGEEEDGSDSYAEQIAAEDHWDLRCLVGLTTTGAKETSSTDGMNRTMRTSAYYDAWVASVDADLTDARAAIDARDFERLAAVAEASCLRMHASAMAAVPGVVYWNGRTVDLMQAIRASREAGLPAFFTIDAGPHVKVFCQPEALAAVRDILSDHAAQIREARPGPAAELLESDQ